MIHDPFEDQAENEKERMAREHEAEVPNVSQQSTHVHRPWDLIERGMDRYRLADATSETDLPAQILDFKQRFCRPEHKFDTERFFIEKFFRDKLIVQPGGVVVGKGLQIMMRDCKIYIEQEKEVYTFNIQNKDEPEEARRLHMIPQDILFIIIGEAKEIFVLNVDREKDGGCDVYRLPEDVVTTIYIETDLYQKLNHFYGCVVKTPSEHSCICHVTSNPKVGKYMYRSFVTAVESNQERRGLGQ